MRRLLPAAAVALLSLGLPRLLPSYTMHVLDSGMIAAIAVVGLNFTFGWAGLISLAQAAFLGIGAYASALLTTRAGLPIWAAWPLAVLATCLGAALFALPMLRLRGHFLALATLGLTVSCGIVASGWQDGLGGTDGLSGIPSPAMFGIALDTDSRYFYLLWAALLVACLVAARVRHSQLGIALVAVRDDEIAASAASIDVPRTKLRAFVLGAGFAGAAGVLFAHFALYVAPDDFNLSQSILYLVMLIVGGEGSIAGAVLGALLLTFLPEWLRFLGTYYLTVYGGLTLLVLMFLPGGLASLVPPPGQCGAARVSALLEVRGLSCRFGGVKAVDGVDFDIPQGRVCALIGPNGAGKTTVMNLLTGFTRPSAGSVRLGGTELTALAPHRITRAGVARTFQNNRLFTRLSVVENVMAGGCHAVGDGVLQSLLRLPSQRRQEAALRDRAHELLGRLGVSGFAGHPVGALSYGHRRLVEIARALASGPRLLLLDEPAAGLNSREAAGLVDIIGALPGQGIATILIEHNMGLVMRVAQRVAVMNFGRKIADGAPADIRRDPAVLDAYLGHGASHA